MPAGRSWAVPAKPPPFSPASWPWPARRPVTPLGSIDPALYRLGAQSRLRNGPSATGIVDVTTGTNTFGNVTGYPARPGYDLASGWGTIDAARFVPALAQAASQHS